MKNVNLLASTFEAVVQVEWTYSGASTAKTYYSVRLEDVFFKAMCTDYSLYTKCRFNICTSRVRRAFKEDFPNMKIISLSILN